MSDLTSKRTHIKGPVSSRSLAARYGLPLTHVDSIQYLSGMRLRDIAETTAMLEGAMGGEAWVIDGFGSFEVMARRFERADLVVFVDFPLWRHYWWCTKRQLASLRAPRAELPVGCDEATISHTVALFRILWRVHREIRPRLIDVFSRTEMRGKVVRIKDVNEWRKVFDGAIR